MNKKIIGLLVGSAITFSVQASDLSYNYAEIGYRSTSIDVSPDPEDIIPDATSLINDVDPGGFYFAGSVGLGDSFFLKGEFSKTSGDAAFSQADVFGDGFLDVDVDLDLDYTQIELGVGYKYPIADQTDLIASVAYIDIEADIAGSTVINFDDGINPFVDAFDESGSIGDDAFALGIGLRSLITPKLELNGQVQYVDFSESQTTFKVGGVYNFTANHSAVLGASFLDDQTDINIGYRFNF